jgi:hypothetical protein
MIRAISLWQPWASLIAIGVKHFETRSWPTSYRGPLAIHASRTKECLALVDNHPAFAAAFRKAGVNTAHLPLGAFVCTCTLVNCLHVERVPPDPFGDYTAGRYAWYLDDIQILPRPIPAKGSQGFWSVDLETLGLQDTSGAQLPLL